MGLIIGIVKVVLVSGSMGSTMEAESAVVNPSLRLGWSLSVGDSLELRFMGVFLKLGQAWRLGHRTQPGVEVGRECWSMGDSLELVPVGIAWCWGYPRGWGSRYRFGSWVNSGWSCAWVVQKFRVQKWWFGDWSAQPSLELRGKGTWGYGSLPVVLRPHGWSDTRTRLVVGFMV